jgi:hypothetical protein
MNIAKKLITIVENEQKVYAAGYTEGLNEGGYTKGYEEGVAVGTEQGKEIGMAEGIEAGKQAEYDAFWDAFQQNGKRKNYTYAFYYDAWTDELYQPKYPMTIEHGNGVFNQSLITDTKVPIDITNLTTNGQVFVGATSLVTIRKLITKEGGRINSKLFGDCNALQNLTWEGAISNNCDLHWSTKLSAKSIRNTIEHLSDNVTGKTLTLSQAAVNNADFGGDTVYMTTDGAFGSYLTSNPIALTAGQRIKIEAEWKNGHGFHDDLNVVDWWFDSTGDTTEYGYATGTPGAYLPRIYTAASDTQVVYGWYFSSTVAVSNIPIKIRAVLVDENDNEITGENLHSFVTTTVTDSSKGTTLTIANESWETLAASKPNWNISLV